MEQMRSTLLPNIIHYLKKYNGPDTVLSNQMVLRVYKSNSYLLTDGFFSIESRGLVPMEQNTFIRAKKWKILLDVENIVLELVEWENLGVESMSDFQIKPLKTEVQIKALMIPAFRIQVRSSLTEVPIHDILEMASQFGDYDF